MAYRRLHSNYYITHYLGHRRAGKYHMNTHMCLHYAPLVQANQESNMILHTRHHIALLADG